MNIKIQQYNVVNSNKILRFTDIQEVQLSTAVKTTCQLCISGFCLRPHTYIAMQNSIHAT